MSRVLLGLYDQPVCHEDVTSYDVNKIGGSPDWMIKESKAPLCRLCGQTSVFIGQLYCPLSGSSYHRTLYVFTCWRPLCCRRPESWTVLRSQRMSVDTSANEVASCPRSAADEWGAEADDWGCDAEEGDYESSDCSAVSNCSPRVSPDGDQHQSTAEEIESRLEHISIGGNSNNTEVEVPSVSVEVGRNCLGNNVMIASAVEADLVLQSCYLYVIDEPLIEDDLKHEQQLLKQYAQREGLDVSTLDEVEAGGERYVASEVRNGERVGDRSIYKFSKRISHCPQQLIRYSYNGKPLFARVPRAATVPRCSCGSARVFELQLMPGLVNYLRQSSETDPVIEYLSVYVFTCGRSCWNDGDGAREEYAAVDYEEDTALVDKALTAMTSVDCTKLATDAMEPAVTE